MNTVRSGVRRAHVLATLLAILIPAALFTGIAPVHAQYPNKPIRFILPFPPGGGTDTLARILGGKLAEGLAQQVILDNRPGAGANIGAELAAKAPPDGYTLLMGNIAHTINMTLYRKLNYNFVKDFSAVSLLASAPNIVVVHPSVPANSVQELVAFAKSRPGKLNFGSAGTGGSVHLAGELFKAMAGIDITHVPYKGTSAAMPDLVSGRIEMMFPSAITAKPFSDNGRLKLLAVTSARRSPDVPQLPTIAESGIAGFEVGIWYGLLAPAGTPPEIVRKLNADIRDIVGTEDFRAMMAKQGVTVAPGTPEQFSAFYEAEIRKWARVVADAKIPSIN